MNRLGFSGSLVQLAHDRLKRLKQVKSVTLMTHFADADGAYGVAGQMAAFEMMTAGLDAPRSVANSAALLRYPACAGDWVRPGIALYGASPFPDRTAAQLGLRAVMTLASEIIALQTLKAGEGVGYGFIYHAQRDMRIGVVACGYADGYPRHAPGLEAAGAPVLVDGVRTRTIGRVAMDMLYVDLTPVPQARIGSPVILWGDGLSSDEVAAAAGTVSYELFCALAARVPVVERQS
jgi:alanine racemase